MNEPKRRKENIQDGLAIAYELDILSNDLEALAQTFNALSIAATANGSVIIGSRALFHPCAELFKVSYRLRELTDQAYKITDKEGN